MCSDRSAHSKCSRYVSSPEFTNILNDADLSTATSFPTQATIMQSHDAVMCTPMRPFRRISRTAFKGERNIRVPITTPRLGTTFVMISSCVHIVPTSPEPKVSVDQTSVARAITAFWHGGTMLSMKLTVRWLDSRTGHRQII